MGPRLSSCPGNTRKDPSHAESCVAASRFRRRRRQLRQAAARHPARRQAVHQAQTGEFQRAIFVLETNIISNLRRKRPHPALPRDCADRVAGPEDDGCNRDRPCGIERVRPQNDALAQEIERWLEALLAASELNILTLDVAASRLLGKMHETPALRHFITTDPNAREQATGADLAIAAISITAGCVVVSENTRHLLQIDKAFPLPGLFNPIDRTWHVEPNQPA
jgi:predicted nucleic acid-binding protein